MRYSCSLHLRVQWKFTGLLLLLAPVAPAQAAPAQAVPIPAELAPRVEPVENVRYAVKDEAEFLDALDLTWGELAELAEVKSAVSDKNWPAAKVAWARHLQTRAHPIKSKSELI